MEYVSDSNSILSYFVCEMILMLIIVWFYNDWNSF